MVGGISGVLVDRLQGTTESSMYAKFEDNRIDYKYKLWHNCLNLKSSSNFYTFSPRLM